MITVEITSEVAGEGKSTVAAIIYAALNKAGYSVEISPVAHPRLDPEEAKHWARRETNSVFHTACSFARGSAESTPRSNVSLKVHG